MTEFENTGGEYNTGGWQFTFALASGNIVMDVPGDVNSRNQCHQPPTGHPFR